ncbi:MAG: hypothetical protein KJ718_03695 [Nanoarchaeota archaeon]|nr:hypothetical protein [Nanoarchaeota archaeon]MBU1051634.1 hypothetical protein [Nanoarchaeota archaeon]MBU1988836.1 hypothetical protein [Nanoarchaeota archaeon]
MTITKEKPIKVLSGWVPLEDFETGETVMFQHSGRTYKAEFQGSFLDVNFMRKRAIFVSPIREVYDFLCLADEVNFDGNMFPIPRRYQEE